MGFDSNDGAVFGILVDHTSDLDRTSAFSSHVMDWRELPNDGPEGVFLKRQDGSHSEANILDATDIGGIQVGQWIPQIAVDDIHATVTKCVQTGGDIIGGS